MNKCMFFHKWTKWKCFFVTVENKITLEKIRTIRQKRVCKRCGKTEVSRLEVD